MNIIPNSLLIEKDLPNRRAAWIKIIPFAQTFNGYEYWGSFKKCQDVAKQGIALHKENKDMTQTLTELRTCLFFEARRWRRLEKKPTKAGLEYVHQLVEAIRLRVQTKNME